jgi:hypothetical protein
MRFSLLKLNTALCALLMLAVSPMSAQSDERVTQATELILKLCIASGVQHIEITKNNNSIEISGKGSSLQIDRKESSGLVGGISKEITALSAQQASEARSCTQRYLRDLVDIILKDDSTQRFDRPSVGTKSPVSADPKTFLETFWERFWDGKGIWEDNQHYCESLREFLAASYNPGNFSYGDNGEVVSPRNISSTFREIEGNYIIRTEPGSPIKHCGIFYHKSGYNALACSRLVSVRRADVFASVYNQTLKDIRDCLLPAGWKQISFDQGACIPSGISRGECVRGFAKESRVVYLFSNLEEGSRYLIGIQTNLGN